MASLDWLLFIGRFTENAHSQEVTSILMKWVAARRGSSFYIPRKLVCCEFLNSLVNSLPASLRHLISSNIEGNCINATCERLTACKPWHSEASIKRQVRESVMWSSCWNSVGRGIAELWWSPSPSKRTKEEAMAAAASSFNAVRCFSGRTSAAHCAYTCILASKHLIGVLGSFDLVVRGNRDVQPACREYYSPCLKLKFQCPLAQNNRDYASEKFVIVSYLTR